MAPVAGMGWGRWLQMQVVSLPSETIFEGLGRYRKGLPASHGLKSEVTK